MMDLEAALSQGQVHSEPKSPDRYAPDALDYFLARLNQPKYFRKFRDIIRSEAGQPLREELSRSPQKIIANAFPQALEKPEEVVSSAGIPSAGNDGDCLVTSTSENFSGMQPTGGALVTDAYFHGLSLVSALVKLMPEWLSSNRPVFDALVIVWKSSSREARIRNERGLSSEQVKESKRLVKCFLNYLRHDKTEVGVLFDMLSIFLVRTRIDYTFLKAFYMNEVAEGYAPQMKKALLVHFLHLFQSKELSQDHLVVSMQMLILPMLVHTFQNSQSWDVVDASIIKTIVEKLLDPPQEVSAEYDEPLRIELLQLATLLLKYLPNDLVYHRKELIKFGWNHLQREDSASRQWAFVNVCHFLEAYQAPEKIILQVFVVLLRTCQPENKVLVNEALDILMPALPRRLPVGDFKTPIWIRFTRKILLEEGHSVPNLIHIFQLIVRHSDLFYSCRAQFVPQMVNSLSRLGFPQNTPPDNRRLAIELAGLVVGWEKRRQAESKTLTDSKGHAQPMDMSSSASVVEGDLSGAATNSKRPSDASGFADDLTKRAKTERDLSSLGVMSPSGTSIQSIGTPGSAAQPDEEYKPNAAMEEMINDFLIRVALVTVPKDKEMSAMYKQALDLLSQALEVWPTANMKFNYFEKLLSSPQASGQNKYLSTALAQGLEVMNKVLEKQPHLFVRNNVQQITQLLEPCFNSKLLDIGKSLCTLLKMVFDAFPLDAMNTPQDIRSLHSKVEELIQKHLVAVTTPQISVDTSSANSMISFALSVIKTLSEGQKSFIDPFVMPLVRVLQCLMREMGAITASIAKQGHRMDAEYAATTLQLMTDLGHRMDAESAAATLRLMTDLGAVTSNLKSILKLIGGTVMLVPECKVHEKDHYLAIFP